MSQTNKRINIYDRVIIYLEGFWFLLEDFFEDYRFLHGEIFKFP
jgi:hypothetical protein